MVLVLEQDNTSRWRRKDKLGAKPWLCFKMMLNQRQERFCLEYFTTGNATQAAITSGYSKKTAVKIASENLTKPDILARLTELREAVSLDVVSNKRQKLIKLEEIYNVKLPKELITPSDKIRAISEHNKMEGDYAPEKHALMGDILIEVVYRDAKENNGQKRTDQIKGSASQSQE